MAISICLPSRPYQLDQGPLIQEKTPVFINEPWMIDNSLVYEWETDCAREPDDEPDNLRIYVPIDLNEKAILRRLNYIIYKYGEANEENESDFCIDVKTLLSQVEIYDQIWYARHMPPKGMQHSAEATELIKKLIEVLETIPDGCAETFPFDLIEDLREEFGVGADSAE